MPTIINNHDLNFGGMPAIIRALNTLAAHVSDLRNRLDLLEYADAQRSQRIATLELKLGADRPAESREVVAELGHGWRIERSPAPDPASELPTGLVNTSGGISADSWLPASWVQDYTAAVEG